jgi:hypothetical protein
VFDPITGNEQLKPIESGFMITFISIEFAFDLEHS